MMARILQYSTQEIEVGELQIPYQSGLERKPLLRNRQEML